MPKYLIDVTFEVHADDADSALRILSSEVNALLELPGEITAEAFSEPEEKE